VEEHAHIDLPDMWLAGQGPAARRFEDYQCYSICVSSVESPNGYCVAPICGGPTAPLIS